MLLHGLGRGFRAMEPLARHLHQAGFDVLNAPYPSRRKSFPELVEALGELAVRHADGKPLAMVTHSMGGILARAIVARKLSDLTISRLVMLAPPNGGSEIIDWLKRYPRLLRHFGPAGAALALDGVVGGLGDLPAEIETAVIMGSRARIPFFQRLLKPVNDGIVSAEDGRLAGLREFRVVRADHTFMPMHPQVMRWCADFLIRGALDDAAE